MQLTSSRLANGSFLVLDNHKSHHSLGVTNLAHSMGLELLYLPPTASELNPVERMWSYFKREWRQRLYDPEHVITTGNAHRQITATLESVKAKGRQLAQGPTQHML